MTRLRDLARSYWVVIPAYNEAETVRDVAMRARQQCPNVIVVDDGSTDGTARALAGLDITQIHHEENRGKAGSLQRGFEHALAHGALGIITLDADGQHAPEEIPIFLTASINAPDVFLVGIRPRDKRKTSFWRYGANRVADFWISWAAGHLIDDTQSGFRLYPATLLRRIDLAEGKERSFVFESEVLIEASHVGTLIGMVTVGVAPRMGSRPSHFRPVYDIAKITLMVAARLLSRGMYPAGLYRVVREWIGPSSAEGFSRADKLAKSSRK